MKRILMAALILNIIMSFFSLSVSAHDDYNKTMKQDLLCFMLSYPEYITGIEKDEQNLVYVMMKSGKKIVYDDMKSKSEGERLNRADLQDTLAEEYPAQCISALMEKGRDPGRYRCYELLNEVYGSGRKEIEKRLKSTAFVYNNVLFNSNNNAADSLSKSGEELVHLMGNAKVSKAVHPGSGTYNYRVIAGTGNLSPHAYGIAIDLARDPRDYWQWASREEGNRRIGEYPGEIVEAFEKNGFIWGGKWYHFDILHFEYRPEILLKARYFQNKGGETWYEGVTSDDYTRGCIEKINNVLE